MENTLALVEHTIDSLTCFEQTLRDPGAITDCITSRNPPYFGAVISKTAAIPTLERVDEQSPAALSGLSAGTIITAVEQEGQRFDVSNAKRFNKIISTIDATKPVYIFARSHNPRDSEIRRIRVVVGESESIWFRSEITIPRFGAGVDG